MNENRPTLARDMQGTAVQSLHAQLLATNLTVDRADVAGATFGASTQQAVVQFQTAHDLPPSGMVDSATSQALAAAALAGQVGTVDQLFTVSGTVYDRDGRPFAGAHVAAADRDLRSEQALGNATSGANGAYTVTYSAASFAAAEGGTADVIVRVLDANAKVLFASDTVYNAPRNAIVDVHLGGTPRTGPSEFAALAAALAPLLGSLTPDQLVENAQNQDVTFLAGESGCDPAQLAAYAVAFRVARTRQLAPEIVYGLLRENVPPAFTSSVAHVTPGALDLGALAATADAGIAASSQAVVNAALQRASDAHVISASAADGFGQALTHLSTVALTAVLERPIGAGKIPARAVFEAAALPAQVQTMYATTLSAHRGPMTSFWTALAKNKTLPVDQIASLRFAHDVGRLTKGHPPLVAALTQMRAAGAVKSARDLAKLDESDWTAILRKPAQTGAIGTPANIGGKTPDEQIAVYAHFLATTFEHTYPTAAFAGRLAKDAASPVPAKADLQTFLNANRGFDLIRTNVDRYLKDHPVDAKTTANPAALRTGLLTVQRVMKVAPRYALAAPLLASGITSAQQIYGMGRDRFTAAVTAKAVPATDAATIYAKAEQVYALALATVTRYNAAFTRATPAAIAPAAPPAPAKPAAPAAAPAGGAPAQAPAPAAHPLDGFPNLQTLFGSLDFCACEECRSVESPAAYLVDSLKFLSERHSNGPAAPLRSVKDVLFDRRPDIGLIELSCANANVPLPYVDLVNEILEDVVAPPADQTAAYRARQTRGTAGELSANPERVNVGAYRTLNSAVFPWTLPYDYAVSEARVYLGQLGVTRAELMRAFSPPPALAHSAGPAPAAPPAAALALAVESLGLSTVQANIILGLPLVPPRAPSDFWGLRAGGNTVVDPADHTITWTGAWTDVLAHVRILLDRSGLAYDELAAVLATQFVNPHGTIAFVPGASACDLGAMTVSGLDPNALDRIHRFVRLGRALGWDAIVLDKVLAAFATGSDIAQQLNPTVLWQIHLLKKAAVDLALPVLAALALWKPIDTHDVPPLPGQTGSTPSLYAQLFLDKAVLNPIDPAFALNAGGEIAAAGQTLTAHAAAIAAALGVRASDVADAVGLLAGGDVLNAANLGSLYRHFTLASALGLSVQDLIALKTISVAHPFDAANPHQLGDFVTAIGKVRAAGLEVATLDYLLRDHFTPSSPDVLSDVAVGTTLRELRVGLQKIASDNAVVPDPSGEATKKGLAIVLAPPDVDAAMRILAGTSALANAAQNAFIAGTLAPYAGDVAAAQTALVGGAALAPGQARFDYVLTRLRAALTRIAGIGYVKTQIANATGADAAVVGVLLTTYLKAGFDPAQPSIEEFLRLPGLARAANAESQPVDPSEAGFATVFATFVALRKCALLFSQLGMSADEVAWLFAHGIAAGWIDPTHLPTTPVPSAGPAFAALLRLLDALALRDALPAGRTPFVALFDEARVPAAKAQFFTDVAALAKWTVADLEILGGARANNADTGLLGLTYPADYADERGLVRMLPAFALIRKLGISAAVADWIAPEPANPDAIKQTVKARYPAEQWAAVAKPLRDTLREQQRDALVAYLLANPPAGVDAWHDPDEISARYLIDVQMGACQLTSRIKQATASVQLFVQRCRLGLEKDVRVDASVDGDWAQWTWMEYYRIWQANRQIFLYPENWIAPELRRDKSPFFKELEAELAQGDVTNDSAENAYRSYLEKLDQVARLTIATVYHEAAAGTDVLHVFARTHGIPPVYYYRRRVDGARWTAWTKVDLDIGTTQHAAAYVWNRRLYLFWLVFAEKADNNYTLPKADFGGPPARPNTHYTVQLAWSEFKDGKWQAKQTATQQLVLTFTDLRPDQFAVKMVESGSTLLIDVLAEFMGSALHVGSFSLGGNGNDASAYLRSVGDVVQRTRDALGILALPDPLWAGVVTPPNASVYSALRIVPTASAVTQHATDPHRYVAPMNVLYDYRSVLQNEIALSSADRYSLVVPHQDLRFDGSLPFFYQDAARAYFVVPTLYYKNGNYFQSAPPAYAYNPLYRAEYTFGSHYHAFVHVFIHELNRAGVPGLLNRPIQVNPNAIQGAPATFDFGAYYKPTEIVLQPYPQEDVDFGPLDGYAIYNWELFFHVPLLIANQLAANQRFDEARLWYQYVFDPTQSGPEPVPQRYWITKPFYQMTAPDYAAQAIDGLTKALAQHDPAAEFQVAQWRKYPFDPHVIAGLRPVAYQRSTVMKYIDNLVAWGDRLFRQDTIESINEATQLYVLALALLGPRPVTVPELHPPAVKTYDDIEADLDAFSNAVVAVENVVAPPRVDVPTPEGTPKLPRILDLYFCVPPNAKLLAYWDTVADRLFKIRHCMNIQGVVRQLALEAPPIDPGLLVAASAAGLDLSSVLADVNAPLPRYRFPFVLRRAVDLCGEVRALGGALLSALEKRDAEALARLRTASEVRLNRAVKTVKEQQLQEATQSIEVLNRNRLTTSDRRDYYRDIAFMNGWEIAANALTIASLIPDIASIVLEAASGVAHLIPDFNVGASGFGGTPHVSAKYGGANVGHSSSKWSTAMRITSAVLHTSAQLSTVMGGYRRRADDWDLQRRLADRELDSLDAQLVGARIREAVARSESANQDVQIQSSGDANDFMHAKYTNQELYDWMVSETASTYFQSYQLAYDCAKQAERCLRFELAQSDASYIRFGYWDSLKKGLLSGDKLAYDLKRMESAYYDQNLRELELTKQISLLALDPLALVELREKGACEIDLPELLFDLDNPGHYLRRIKSVALSIPCVAGPYVGVSATLTLLDNSYRYGTALLGGADPYARAGDDATRFRDDPGGIDAIVTSTARNDDGLFSLDMHDDRYLPFEGAGAIGRWKLRLNPVYSQFDPRTITDAVLQLRYTARDGGERLRGAAVASVQKELNAIALAESRHGLYRLVAAKQQFPTAWQHFTQPAGGGDQVFTFTLPEESFPFFTRGLDLRILKVELAARAANAGPYDVVITPPGAADLTGTASADGVYGTLHHWGPQALGAPLDVGRGPLPARTPVPAWNLKLRRTGAPDFRSLPPGDVDDVLIVFTYEVRP